MKIRGYTPADLETIQRLHNGQGFELPDLEHPLMVVKSVVVDDEDRIRMAAFGRLHVSALLFVDPTYGTPELRFETIRELQKDMDSRAGALGLDMATTQAEGRFAERLKELGWLPGWGTMFYREVL